MIIDNLLKHLGLFWQYPVITELEFYRQNKGDSNYFPFPWATVIDKRVDLQRLLEVLKKVIPVNNSYYTCCQHIRFRELKQLWIQLGINTVYTPHKCLGNDVLGSIKLTACPLYAVNLEDDARNQVFKNIDLPETISNLLGFDIKSISSDFVTLSNNKKYPINLDNLSIEEKENLITLLKPLIWWGE